MTLHDAEIDLQTRPDQACFGLYRTAVPFESEFLLIDRRRGQQSRFDSSFEPVRGVWADITDVGCTLAFPSRALCFPIAKGDEDDYFLLSWIIVPVFFPAYASERFRFISAFHCFFVLSFLI